MDSGIFQPSPRKKRMWLRALVVWALVAMLLLLLLLLWGVFAGRLARPEALGRGHVATCPESASPFSSREFLEDSRDILDRMKNGAGAESPFPAREFRSVARADGWNPARGRVPPRAAAEKPFAATAFRNMADGRDGARGLSGAVRSAEIEHGLEWARMAKRAGSWRECLAAAESVLALDPANAEARDLKAQAESRLGRLE